MNCELHPSFVVIVDVSLGWASKSYTSSSTSCGALFGFEVVESFIQIVHYLAQNIDED